MLSTPRRGARGWIATGVAILAAAASLTAAQAAQAIQFEGPVLSKDADAKTFRMNPENHSNVTLKVTDGTKFQRINGFGELHRGLDIEVRASRDDGHWVASRIEKHARGGNGGGGGDDR